MNTNTKLFFLFVVLKIYFSKVYCYIFDVDNSVQFSLNKTSYFGYSLLLQSGEEESILIVGAPKNLQQPLQGGEVYRCPISLHGESVKDCQRYASNTYLHNQTGSKLKDSTANGDFFGESLDGGNLLNDPFVACAPRYENIYDSYKLMEGVCLLMNSSSAYGSSYKLSRIGKSAIGKFNGKGYHRASIPMDGFDVSFISQNKILTAAPGMDKLEGAVAEHTMFNEYFPNLMPDRASPDLNEDDTYFGYTVTHARFQDKMWYISGAPRGSDLKGKVSIFTYDDNMPTKIKISNVFEGNEVGSYFGASVLALDVNNDGNTDLVIGAPMSAGKSYDEGKVYYYEGRKLMQFYSPIILAGSSSMAARFGTKIVSLGDFDRDGYNDVAISAPYENGGTVYIYRGGKNGLSENYSQKITKEGSLGFGLGLSRGNDVDGNGHNDLAIGAYKSDKFFIIKSKTVIDQEVVLTSPLNSITNITTTINLELCIKYKTRTQKKQVQNVHFTIIFDLDYRIIDGGNLSKTMDVAAGEPSCETYMVDLKENMIKDISPLQIKVTVEVTSPEIEVQGTQNGEVQIPFAHNCGDDNVCTPDLYVKISSQMDHITLGKDKTIIVDLEVKNKNETAYQCEVVFTLTDKIELFRKGCVQVKGKYRCLVADNLAEKQVARAQFSFDIGELNPDTKTIEIIVEVVSLGKQLKNFTNRDSLKIGMILDSTPYIQWKTDPETTQIELVRNVTDQVFTHIFILGKHGVSPLKIDLMIVVPLLKQDGLIFEVEQIEGTFDGNQLTVTYNESENLEFEENDVDLSNLKITLNRTVVVSVFETQRIMKYRVSGPYLRNEELAYFRMKVLVRSKLLTAKFRNELTVKDMVAFVPTVVVPRQSNQSLYIVPSLFLIFVNRPSMVPLWVYILAPTVGLVFYILIASALYKCHFFNRIYKDKLEQEKILCGEDADNAVSDEIFDDVVFRPL